MDMSSEELIKAFTDKKRPEATRPAQAQSRTDTHKAAAGKTVWHMLKDFAKQVWYGPRPIDEVLHSEENLYHAEKLGMTPQELHRLIEKSRLYERIARGSALVEAETLSQKLREGR